ncbi:MAG: hypothetical protein EXS10_00180 [Phycisphaerales bacterium]|nr:hypothetical protein [Phycisphaerales bacterium]
MLLISRKFSFALALSCTTLVGCTIAPPSITLTSVRRAATNTHANEYELEFAVRNTDDAAVELEAWTYSVTAPDGSTYGGTWAALAVLPGSATKSLIIPAVLDATPSTAPGTSLRVHGELGYRDPGNLARLLRQMGLLASRSAFEGSAIVVEDLRPLPIAAAASTTTGASVTPATPAPIAPAK